MAFAAVNVTGDPRAASFGPLKLQRMKFTALSGDTSGTVTCDSLYLVQSIMIDGGLVMSAAPTFSGNAVTLAFNDPTASVFGDILVMGK